MPMTGASITAEQRLRCRVIAAYAGAMPGLAVITRLIPVCLPGLIAPYDASILMVAAAMWLVGSLLIARHCHQGGGLHAPPHFLVTETDR